MGYQLACTCGNVLTFTNGLAGSTMACPCGLSVRIPSLRELRALNESELAAVEAAQYVPVAAPDVSPDDELGKFHGRLTQLTPRAYATPLLVAANVAVFLIMAASGVSLTRPTIEELLAWGADFGPKTLDGEWWRLLTCAFLHAGFLHLLFNMWALASAGRLVERMLGTGGFLVVYLSAATVGSLASLFWHPMQVSVGASGAVFGVCGALASLLLRGGGTVPAHALIRLRNGAVAFILYNLLFTFFQEGIDTAAHLGGLAAGLLFGAILGRPLTPEWAAGRPKRNLAALLVAAVLVAAGMATARVAHGDVVQSQRELDRFAADEARILAAYNRIEERAIRGEINDAEFAEALDREVLSGWRASRRRISELRLPREVQTKVDVLVRYMELREEGWDILADALRAGDPEKIEKARERHRQADELAKLITSNPK